MIAKTSSVRWHMVGMLMALCFISHFNRVSMSVAGTDRIIPDYQVNPTRMGTVYSAFLLVYSIAMIPGGLLIDRFGPRRALMLVGFGSALFAALTGVCGLVATGAAGLLMSLVMVRGLMGLVSAPLHPAAARMVGNWFGPDQRNLANGVITGAAIAGVASTYSGFGALIGAMGWKYASIASAAATALLTAGWAFYATDRPGQHPRVTAGELARIGASPADGNTPDAAGSGTLKAWGPLLRNRHLLLVTLSYAAVGYFQYLFVYWMQFYFDSVLHLGKETSKVYAGIPQLAMALTMPLGGALADRLSRGLGVRRGRALVSGVGMVLSAALLGLGILARDPIWIVTWFTLALGAIGASEGPFWATAVDIGGSHGGTAAAICNTGGNLGGLLAPVLTPWISERAGWPWGIGLGGIICFLGALCWCRIDPRHAGPDSRLPIVHPR